MKEKISKPKKTKIKTERESQIQQKIMLEISKNPMNLVVRRNVGQFKTIDDRYIFIGQVGEADVQGIIGNQKCKNCGHEIHPLPFAIEVKDEKNEQTDEQILWQKSTWERRGGLYILARSVEDAMKGLGLI